MLFEIVCMLLAAPLISADPTETDRSEPAQLQGAWCLISAESENGEADLLDPGAAIVVKKDRVLYHDREVALLLPNADAKWFQIDFHFGGTDRAYEGVCAIHEEKLKICLNRRADGIKERPDSFSLDGHPLWSLFTFEMAKPDQLGPGAGFIGLSLRGDVEANETTVAGVLDGSPAKKAGLMVDDVLLSVGGTRVTGKITSAIAAVRRAKPGEELLLNIRRGGKEQEQKLAVGILPLELILGLTLE